MSEQKMLPLLDHLPPVHNYGEPPSESQNTWHEDDPRYLDDHPQEIETTVNNTIEDSVDSLSIDEIIEQSVLSYEADLARRTPVYKLVFNGFTIAKIDTNKITLDSISTDELTKLHREAHRWHRQREYARSLPMRLGQASVGTTRIRPPKKPRRRSKDHSSTTKRHSIGRQDPWGPDLGGK